VSGTYALACIPRQNGESFWKTALLEWNVNVISCVLQRVSSVIIEEYKSLANRKHTENKKRFEYLHAKLSHIKKLVHAYDAERYSVCSEGGSNSGSSRKCWRHAGRACRDGCTRGWAQEGASGRPPPSDRRSATATDTQWCTSTAGAREALPTLLRLLCVIRIQSAVVKPQLNIDVKWNQGWWFVKVYIFFSKLTLFNSYWVARVQILFIVKCCCNRNPCTFFVSKVTVHSFWELQACGERG